MTTRLEFCKLRNPDGTVSNVSGVPINVTITPITADTYKARTATLRPPAPFAELTLGVSAKPAFLPANETVYKNDLGSNFVAEEGNSCLDDMTLTAGADNKAWKIVTFGVHLATTSRTGKFLVRWIGWETYTTGRGAGVSAFDDQLFDAGFYLERGTFSSGSDTFQLTIDLTASPIFIVPNQTCYFAQQYREPHVVGSPPAEDGEGQFTSTWNVFSNQGPQVGGSEDLFWFDDPQPDGVYDETEVDNFGTENPGAGNFFFEIAVASTNTQDLNPISFQWLRGQAVSGTLGSLWFDDQSYLVGRKFFVLNAAEAPIQLVTETFSPTQAITSLRIDVDAKVSTSGLGMKIELYNFTTNQYVQVYNAAASTSDLRGIGFAANPSQFVQSGTNTIRAKTSFYQIGIVLNNGWTASVDQVQWKVTTS